MAAVCFVGARCYQDGEQTGLAFGNASIWTYAVAAIDFTMHALKGVGASSCIAVYFLLVREPNGVLLQLAIS